MTLSKEKLEEKRSAALSLIHHGHADVRVFAEETLALIDELLERRERDKQEPVAWRNKDTGWIGTVIMQGKSPSECGYEPLYISTTSELLPFDIRVGGSVTIAKGNQVSVLLEVLRAQSAEKVGKFEFVIDSEGQPVAQPAEKLAALLTIAKNAAEDADAYAHNEFNDDSMKHTNAIALWEASSDMSPAPVVQPAVVMPDEMAISDDMNLFQKSFAQGHNACLAAIIQGKG